MVVPTPHRLLRGPAGEQTPDGPVPEWHITDIVSQTDVLRLLAANVGRLDAAYGASLASLGLVNHSVQTVTADTPTLAGALRLTRPKAPWLQGPLPLPQQHSAASFSPPLCAASP
jgi:hypothetical protein